MSEIGVSILFAAWFVTAYLLVSKAFQKVWQYRAYWRRLSQLSLDAVNSSGAKRIEPFLTTDELSQHHSRKVANLSSENKRALFRDAG